MTAPAIPPTKSQRVKPWQPILKPKRFTFPHVALVDFGPLWQLARTNFDHEMRRNPDAVAAAVVTAILHLNDLAERGGNDLTVISDMRNIYIVEQSSGAADAAAAGDCYLGQLMRHVRCWLDDPKAAKKAQTKTRKYLHKVRRRKAYQLERGAEKSADAEAAESMRKIAVMNANIDIDVRNTIEYRGLSNVGPIKDIGYQVAFRPGGRSFLRIDGKTLEHSGVSYQTYGSGFLPIPIMNGHVTNGHGGTGRGTRKNDGYQAGGGPDGGVVQLQGGLAARRRELKFEVGDKSGGAKSVFDCSKGGARVGAEQPEEKVVVDFLPKKKQPKSRHCKTVTKASAG